MGWHYISYDDVVFAILSVMISDDDLSVHLSETDQTGGSGCKGNKFEWLLTWALCPQGTFRQTGGIDGGQTVTSCPCRTQPSGWALSDPLLDRHGPPREIICCSGTIRAGKNSRVKSFLKLINHYNIKPLKRELTALTQHFIISLSGSQMGYVKAFQGVRKISSKWVSIKKLNKMLV